MQEQKASRPKVQTEAVEKRALQKEALQRGAVPVASIVEALASTLGDSPASDLARVPEARHQAAPIALCCPAWPPNDGSDKLPETS